MRQCDLIQSSITDAAKRKVEQSQSRADSEEHKLQSTKLIAGGCIGIALRYILHENHPPTIEEEYLVNVVIKRILITMVQKQKIDQPWLEHLDHIFWGPMLAIFVASWVGDFVKPLITLFKVLLLQRDAHRQHSSVINPRTFCPCKVVFIALFVDNIMWSR